MPTVHLIVKGKVQGVFYSATAKKAAQEHGITGWVQNTEDGHVEIVASGSQQALKKFAEWCRKGPSMATVTGVEVMEKDEQRFDEFEIRR